MNTGVRWVLVAVVVAVATALAVWWPHGSAGTSTPGPAAPDLTADRRAAALPPCVTAAAEAPAHAPLAGVRVTCLATGSDVDLGRLLAGGPALVNVWATWCSPCRAELPALAGYAGTPGAIRVIGVQVQSDQKDGLDLLAGLGVHLPTVYDGSGAASRALRLPVGLPVSYFVRTDGSATLIADRPVFTSAAQVRQVVGDYLGGRG